MEILTLESIEGQLNHTINFILVMTLVGDKSSPRGTHQLHATNSRSVPPHPACDEWNVDMY